MKIPTLIFTILVAFLFVGCPEESDENPDAFLILKNASSDSIIHPVAFNTLELLPNRFPTIPDNRKLGPSQEHKIAIYFRALQDNNKLWILIIKQSTLDSHTWEEIKAQGIYDKRYEFTLGELQALNYQIIYNGS